MLILYILTVFITLFIVYNLVFLLINFKNKWIDFFVKIGFAIGIFIFGYSLVKYFNIADFTYYTYISIPTFIISFIISLFSNKTKIKEKPKYQITLEHEKGKVTYDNPFNGFLIYGGAEAGKTASIGKPLLKEYIRNGFGFFIYDAKENDYTLTGLKLAVEFDYQIPIYYFDFLNPSKSYRTNIFSKENIPNDIYLQQYARIFFDSYLEEDEKKTEWYSMALQLFIGVCYVFYNQYEKYCTLPHICNFILHNTNLTIVRFILKDDKATGFANAFLSAFEDSPKTLGSIKTTVSNKIGAFASNENFCYILSGNDFNLNPIEENNPKSICVSNVFNLRDVLSPIVVLLFNSVARKFKYGNKHPFVFFMDEATTFKIDKFESYPSELREYQVAFVVLTQSPGKIEKLYTRFDRSSLESNLANQFYGWTADTLATDNYAKQFSEIDEKYRSFTTGGGRNTKSTTTSTRKEVRFDTEFFGSLKPGEFVGKTKNANIKTFNTRFKQYSDGKLSELPNVRNVSAEDIKKHYKQMIIDVKNIF